MNKFLNSLLFLILISAPLLAQDEPGVNTADKNFENRMARIYQKFNENEIPDAEWNKIAGEKSSENYTLQSGDSLWEVSIKYFGNGFYWPKVWQLNDKITNPHMIIVGNNLKFSSGNDVAPPSLDVQQNAQQNLSENDDVEDSESVAVESEEKPNEIVKSKIMIPKGRHSTEPLAEIPDSFPEWRENFGNFDENGFANDEPDKKATLATNAMSYLIDIASDKPWQSAGEVSEMEGDKTVAATYERVVVKLNTTANSGDVLTVFKNGDNIVDPDDKVVAGDEISIKGTLVIKEPVQGDTNTYAATVTKSIQPIEMGDSVINGDLLVKSDFMNEGTQSTVSAKVLDAERVGRKNIGFHEAVYLNRGEKDGLQVGAILDVLKNYQVRNADSKVKFDSQIVAKIKIVNVGQDISTAVVVKSYDSLLPGDETAAGGPPAEPTSPPPAPETIQDAPAPQS